MGRNDDTHHRLHHLHTCHHGAYGSAWLLRIFIFKNRKAGTLHASPRRAHRFHLWSGNGFYGLVNTIALVRASQAIHLNNNRVMKSKISYIKVFLFSALCISTLILIFLYSKGYLVQNTFGFEVGKICLQIIAVTVFGTIATYLLNKFNHSQQDLVRKEEQRRMRNENNDQLRKKIISSLNDVYADIKLSRRMLRAKALSDSYENIGKKEIMVQLVEYDKYVEIINNSQLKIEIIEKEIETNASLFTDQHTLSNKVGNMHKLMNKVVEEYEDTRPAFKEILSLNKLPNLRDVLIYSKDNFFHDFVNDYKDVLESLRSK